MRKQITTTLLALLFMCTFANAQDMHFSQYYASPLTLNPALTGIMNANIRVAAIYRNQWSSVTIPYKTPAISGDVNNLLQKPIAKYLKKGTASAGLYLLNDKAGDGALSTLQIMPSFAYLLDLDKDKKMHLSIGLSACYTNKSIDYYKLNFESQFQSPLTGFLPYNGYNNGEGALGTDIFKSFGYADFNTGALFIYNMSTKLDLWGGFVLNHMIGPKESFKDQKVNLINGEINKLNGRHVMHFGARVGLSDKIDLRPSLLVQGQTKSFEANVGSLVEYKMKGAPNDFLLFGGLYDRIGDAFIVTAGGEYKHIRLGLSYDLNTSKLNVASNGKGGFEISLIWLGFMGVAHYPPPIMNCPRM